MRLKNYFDFDLKAVFIFEVWSTMFLFAGSKYLFVSKYSPIHFLMIKWLIFLIKKAYFIFVCISEAVLWVFK